MGWGIAFAVLAIISVKVVWLDHGRNKEVVGAVEVLNPEGKTGTAFVVYLSWRNIPIRSRNVTHPVNLW